MTLLLNHVAGWIERIAGLFLAVIALMVFVSSLARYLFNSPIPDAHAFSSLLLGIAILWGLASACWRDSNISVDIVYLVLPVKLRWLSDLMSQLLITLFIVLFCWMLFRQVQSVMHSGQVTVDLRLSIWPFYLLAWFGLVATLLLQIARIWLFLFRPASLPDANGAG